MAFSNCGKMTIAELRKLPDWNVIPAAPGTYRVVADVGFTPQYRNKSSTIPFKGKDPSIDVAVLKDKWVNSAQVIYIGKAGGLNQRATLRQRIKAYIKFGNGLKAAHWGGRYIWQLENVDELYLEWETCGADEEPATLEHNELVAFKNHYGKLPFANLRT